MTTIAYASPLVPVEWIAAHGLQPRWLRPGRGAALVAVSESSRHTPCAVRHGSLSACADDARSEPAPAIDLPALSGRRGVCPYAASLIEAAAQSGPGTAVVLALTCDQLRYAGSLLEYQGAVPVFLMNVPTTWQTPAATALYVEELRRLGRFLVRQGGKQPGNDELAEVMRQFDGARAQVRQARGRLSARQFAAALIGLREGADMEEIAAQGADRQARGVPLALVGGPLAETDYDLFDWLEQAGGRIVLDATEGGERTLPRPFDLERTGREPFQELAAAYFTSIPDVFRRPNSACYEYLGREMAARHVRGIVFRRYLWCDLWHAELARLKAWSPVPVLDLDVAQSEASAEGRTLNRLEAFLETLVAAKAPAEGYGFPTPRGSLLRAPSP